jgi:hypothetical protein
MEETAQTEIIFQQVQPQEVVEVVEATQDMAETGELLPLFMLL